MIYFVGCEAFVKIGFTASDLRGRLSAMQTGNPFELWLMHLIDGTEDEEGQLHEAFARWSHRGEWFVREPIAPAIVGETASEIVRRAALLPSESALADRPDNRELMGHARNAARRIRRQRRDSLRAALTLRLEQHVAARRDEIEAAARAAFEQSRCGFCRLTVDDGRAIVRGALACICERCARAAAARTERAPLRVTAEDQEYARAVARRLGLAAVD